MHQLLLLIFLILCDIINQKGKGVFMSGYTVTNSIDLIDEYCETPSRYKSWQLSEAIKDARTHYEYGNTSRAWYESVVRILSPYT